MESVRRHKRSQSSLYKTRKELMDEVQYLKNELEKYKSKCKMLEYVRAGPSVFCLLR